MKRKGLLFAYAAVALVLVLVAGPSLHAAVNRAIPTGNADGTGTQTPSRAGTYLEAYTLPLFAGPWLFADEGSMFVATNATLATGIAGHAAPVVADTDTKALLHLFNGGTKRIYPLYLQMEVTAAGTAGTLHYTTVYVDNKGSTARSSGGTAITPVNTLSTSTTSTGATLYFGAVVTAMSSSKKVGQQIVREVIPVVQDTIMIDFTPSGSNARSALTTAGTATNHSYQRFPPIVIAPGGNLNISQIRPSQSAAASYQFEFAYIER
jgi:hypothetical protein